MGLKQKFLALAGVVGLLMAVMSIIGYYMASSNLQESVETELRATVARDAANLDGWLREKKAVDVSTANTASEMKGDMSRIKTKATMGTIVSDKEILAISACSIRRMRRARKIRRSALGIKRPRPPARRCSRRRM